MTPKEKATNDLIGALLTWARQGAHILDHMSRHGGGELGSDESLDILAELIRPILKPVVARQSPSDLRKVSAVLLDSYHLVADELLFVDTRSDALCSHHAAHLGHAARRSPHASTP